MQHKTIAICGSFRFWDRMQEVAEQLALQKGWTVLMPLAHVLPRTLTDEEKQRLGQQHLTRIDLSDAIYVVNVDGYMGDAVAREIAYAKDKGKTIFYLIDPT